MFAASKTDGSSELPDPQFNYVTMLLHGDGNNGAQNNTFLDSSTNNFTITRNGNTTQGSFSPYGPNWSVYFNGSSRLDYPSSANLALGSGDWTVQFWANFTLEPTDNQTAVELLSMRLIIGRKTNKKVRVFLNGAKDGANSGPTLENGQWNYIVIARTGTTVNVYVNSTSVYSFTDSTNFSTSTLATVGRNNDAAEPMTGYVSNVRILKGTYNISVPTAPYTAITNTQLLTCQSNRFVDNSANNFTVSPSGSVSVQRFNPFGTSTAYSTSVIGGSAYFDGSGDSLVTPTSSNLNVGTGAFQIDFWMYSLAIPAQYVGPFSANNAGGNGGIFFAYRSGNLDFTNNYDTAGVISAPYPALNQWHHIALVRNSSNVRSYYIDGVRVGTLSNSVDFNQTEITVGHVSWNGYISNFRTIVGSNVADPTSSTITIPTAPTTAVSNTQLLTNFINGAIFDNAMMNDLETVGNAQISTSVVKYGTGSMSFDGTGDWLIMPYGPTQNFRTGNFTIEGWCYLNSLAASYYVPAGTWNSGTSDEWLIQIRNDGYIRFLTTAGSTFYSASITTSTWYHIAIVRNGSIINIYVNGTSVGNYTCTNSLGSTAKTLYIGTQAGTWDWNGYIDDFRITNGYARYTATFTPPTAAFSNTGPY